MKEIWKDLSRCNKYECSNLGRIRDKKTKNILKGSVDNHGYVRYDLCSEGKRFVVSGHRAVAETFIPLVKDKKYINHIDGNKTNNIITNLEWCTAKENTMHSINILGKQTGGLNKKPIICIETGIIYNSAYEAENIFNIHHGVITSVLKGRKKAWRKLHFKYIELPP